jgi:hypothetical protein
MPQLSVFYPPIPTADLMQIEDVLRAGDIFCTSFPDEDPYSVALHYSRAEMDGVGAWIVLDRNVFSRVVDLAKGSPAKGEQQKIAAAVRAFAQCGDINFLPTLAVYEGEASQAASDAANDWAMFLAADNLDPWNFASIALGKSSHLSTKLAPVPDDAILIASQPTPEFSFLYPLVLNVGLIELQGGAMPDRMRRFLDWSYSNWYLSAAATVFAAMCFSGTPPKRALKDLRNSDRSLALKGLRNAAWDLTYVTCWVQLLKRQNQENRLYMFCTRDKALRRLAHQMLVKPHVADEDIAHELRALLGSEVRDHYLRLVARQGDPAREVNRPEFERVSHGRQIAAGLEQELRRP